jgi:hypothetical protein
MRRHHLSNKCKLSKRRATYDRRDQRRNNRKTSNNVERAWACLATNFTAYARRKMLHVFPRRTFAPDLCSPHKKKCCWLYQDQHSRETDEMRWKQCCESLFRALGH